MLGNMEAHSCNIIMLQCSGELFQAAQTHSGILHSDCNHCTWYNMYMQATPRPTTRVIPEPRRQFQHYLTKNRNYSSATLSHATWRWKREESDVIVLDMILVTADDAWPRRWCDDQCEDKIRIIYKMFVKCWTICHGNGLRQRVLEYHVWCCQEWFDVLKPITLSLAGSGVRST